MNASTINLPDALAGESLTLNGRAGMLTIYRSTPPADSDSTPLLLVHSVNAAAGAHEVRPLFDHYRNKRPVYALDLPGYGKSERSEREYTPRMMTDALLDLLDQIQRDHGEVAVDILGVSLGCEFVSRVATEVPLAFRSVALVSPTALNRNEPLRGEPGSNRGIPWLLRIFSLPRFGTGLFRILTTRASVRFFLRKTWGSKQIDEEMFEYSYLTTKHDGAHRAPFHFLSAFLFSADAFSLYESLTQPVWMCHGVRGDFTDYRLKDRLVDRANWELEVFDSGALPYFEHTEAFTESYQQFLRQL